jgi:hypothetical protein
VSYALTINGKYAGQFATAGGAELFTRRVLQHSTDGMLTALCLNGISSRPKEIATQLKGLLKDHAPKNDAVRKTADNLLRLMQKTRLKTAIVMIVD